jgi:hypothetical protein
VQSGAPLFLNAASFERGFPILFDGAVIVSSPELKTCRPSRSGVNLCQQELHRHWLGGRDSNPDSAGQSRMSYR